MTTRNRLAKALAVVLPAGSFGASLVLALASSSAASPAADPKSQSPSGAGVSIRLQEIRTGISSMSGSASDETEGNAKASPAWWGNGGWGRWHLGWGNGGGWRNGGWRNGGWGNGGWPNWH